VEVIDYIKNFKWEDNKFQRGRSLVEIAGMINDVLISLIPNLILENETN